MKNMISRRNFLAAAGVVAAAGVLTACGGSSASTAASSTAASAAASTARSSSSLLDASYITINTASPCFTGNSLCRLLSTISINSLSKNSIAVGTNGRSNTFGTISAHSSKLLNGITNVLEHVGAGNNFNVTSVKIHKIPSEPITKSFTSNPVVFFTTLDEKFMMEPSGITASIQRTKSLVRPYLTAFIPPALVMTFPPIEAVFSPGSGG